MGYLNPKGTDSEQVPVKQEWLDMLQYLIKTKDTDTLD